MSPVSDDGATYPCPACGAKLWGWTAARHPVGAEKLILDRCEDCGLVVTRAPEPPDVKLELSLLEREGDQIVAPNRRSFSGGIGGAQWAGMEPEMRRLHLNPEAARLLLAAEGSEVKSVRARLSLRGYRLMVQTLINAFTLRDNFIANARSGRIAPGSGSERAKFMLDALVSGLVALPMAVLALPLEVVAAALARGGIMRIGTTDH